MVIIITGASHTGKTKLAQKLLEKYQYPYLSIDHLKMGLIRSKMINVSVYDDENLTGTLWPVVSEMIKTAIENKQNLIVEGCYIPSDWQKSFDDDYLNDIKFICLYMTKGYIMQNYNEIIKHSNDIENRIMDEISIDELIKDNESYLKRFKDNNILIINNDYQKDIDKWLGDHIYA